MNQLSAIATTRVEGQALIVERIFQAPRELVWDAWTKPEHVARWWGYGGVPLFTCEIDLRVGGTYRYVQRGQDGTEFPFTGTYREIAKHERLNYTMIFDVAPYNEHESLIFDSFEQLDVGRTKLTMRTEYASAEALQGSIASGAEQGAIASMERYAEYLAMLQQAQ
ncbi:SRPBCC domain-containing protein [Cohnella lupini]|uniref:Uncharacterized protein YndB with AHSA1/START domain n=1 Tax=Cohnella lupini TaxID=1294267 RepID=A0A3D9I0H8_9BACL|nr:SRPBCC domain-containing protein [Cohnella lupini]RED55151.1 uncharacterized protein YndB with AHSA1/START domain [Cohnella lupini]